MIPIPTLASAAITLTLTPDGAGLRATPREALTEPIRELIRTHKPMLIAAMQRAADSGMPWVEKDGASRLAGLVNDVRAWVALDTTVGALAVDLTQQAQAAVFFRDMANLVEVIVAYQELHEVWLGHLLPEVSRESPAITWACSKWENDPLTLPMSSGSSRGWYAEDDAE